MKIGDYVPVKANGTYAGQGIEWTEELISVEITKRPMVLYHSSEEKISEFQAKQTCFHEGYAIRGHVYVLELPAGVEVERYPGREIRVELTEDMRLRYLGQMKCDYEFFPDGRVRETASYSQLLKSYLKKEEYHWETVS
jgi:hypothetical protein